MKKKFYLPLGIVALAFAATGCTAEDPDNALAIDKPLYVNDNGTMNPGNPENPLSTRRLYNYNFRQTNYEIDYNGAGSPLAARVSDYNYSQSFGEYQFGYLVDDKFPESVTWNEHREVASDDVYYMVTAKSLENMQFNDKGYLVSAIFSGESIEYGYSHEELSRQPLDGYNVAFEYDNAGHLTNIKAGNTEYRQEWNANGDLVQINSPEFGMSTVTYSEVTNKYGQWDPTLPFMGFFQTFGWFGVAPVHFPNGITTMIDANDSQMLETAVTYKLDYEISYDGMISTMKWALPFNNEVYVNFQYRDR